MVGKKGHLKAGNPLSLKKLDDKMTLSNEAIDKRMEGFSESLDQILKAVSAKNVPTSITKDGVDCRDVYQKKDLVDIEFKDGDPNDDAEVLRPGLTCVDNAEFVDKMDQHRFDMELVEIMVMPSSSQYPDHSFTVGVNGRLKMIIRGKKQWLPRCYVEVLLRAKTSSYGNIETVNPYNNEMTVKNPETKSHRYPLQILSDKSPLGGQWLERVSNDVRA